MRMLEVFTSQGAYGGVDVLKSIWKYLIDAGKNGFLISDLEQCYKKLLKYNQIISKLACNVPCKLDRKKRT